MTTMKIFAGICGFTTVVRGEDKGGYRAMVNIESECPNWKRVNEVLGGKEINVMTELFKDKKTGTLNSQVLDVSLNTIPHVSCPVIGGGAQNIGGERGARIAKGCHPYIYKVRPFLSKNIRHPSFISLHLPD